MVISSQRPLPPICSGSNLAAYVAVTSRTNTLRQLASIVWQILVVSCQDAQFNQRESLLFVPKWNLLTPTPDGKRRKRVAGKWFNFCRRLRAPQIGISGPCTSVSSTVRAAPSSLLFPLPFFNAPKQTDQTVIIAFHKYNYYRNSLPENGNSLTH